MDEGSHLNVDKLMMNKRLREIRSTVIQTLGEMDQETQKEAPRAPAPAASPSSDAAPPQKMSLLERTIVNTVEPLVTAWLDKNLYAIVERIVREEVSRYSRKKNQE